MESGDRVGRSPEVREDLGMAHNTLVKWFSDMACWNRNFVLLVKSSERLWQKLQAGRGRLVEKMIIRWQS